MSIKLHDWFHRLHQDNEGGLSAEYVAVLIVIGAIVAALWSAGIDKEITKCGDKAAKSVFNMENDKPC